MPTAIDFSRIEAALSVPAGWLELALVGACLAVAWLVDRRVSVRTDHGNEIVRAGLGGVGRLIFPLASLALLVAAAIAFRRWQPPFFLYVALPLVFALALIRILVYAMRGVFGGAAWLGTSERAISFTAWGLVALYFLGVLPEIGAELDAIRIPVGRTQVSVLEIGKGVVVVLVTIAATLWLSGLIERRIEGAATLSASLRTVLAKSMRAVLLVVGVLFALQAVGIDLTLLSVFGGALGVGIGLGLQKLASNYIAGFTILLDRSIRMGDLITVDGRQGVVSSVTSRYVVVKSLDGIDAIVPNETLVTTTVLNHSYTSRNVRVALTAQVTYDSDVDLALSLMVAAAQAQPRVLKAPDAPAATVARLADSGIELELGIWIADPEKGSGELRSTINRAILRSFAEHGIRIPVAQREVRVVDFGSAASARPPAK
jgi:small-conductance mechanosensitive channel